MEDDYDLPEQQRAQSAYFDDLDKKTMSDKQEHQPIGDTGSKIRQQEPGYQNVSMTGSGRGQTKVTDVEEVYDLPESDENDKQQGNYEELDKKSMDKDHAYQALAKGNTQPSYQNVKL